VFEYDRGHLLVLAAGLPIASQVIRASQKEPDPAFVRELGPSRVREAFGLGMLPIDPGSTARHKKVDG
jgi:hypothetical protein